MKILNLPRHFVGLVRACLHQWTDTDHKAYRTCGMAFLLFAAFLALPSLFGLVLHFGQNSSGLRIGTAGYLASYLLSSIGLALGTSITSTLAGIALLSEAARMRERKLSEPDSLRRCGYLMLGLSLLVLFPLLSSVANLITGQIFPFRMPFAAIDFFRAFSALFYRLCYLGLPLIRRHEAMSWIVFGGYTLALNAFGLAVLSLAIDLLKRSQQSTRGDIKNPSALANHVWSLRRFAGAFLHRQINTEVKAYRVCGVVCFLFAAILVLPVVWFQVSTVFFQDGMTTVVDVWLTGGSQSNSFTVVPTLLMLVITLGAAMVASIAGIKWFAKARLSREPVRLQCKRQCKRTLQRFAWLLLVMLPIATVFHFRWGNSYTSIGQLNLSKLFSTIDSSWREARATFLWMQFYPLLLLGLVALALAVSMRSQHRKEEKASSLEEKK